jgi:D-3-phosphoglycerate dehydrogenase
MSSKPKVVFGDVQITPAMETHFVDLAGLVEFVHAGNSTADDVANARADACVWVSRTSPVTRLDLASMRAVKMLSAWGVGYDHIDIRAATALAIPVCINPYFSRSVSEAALTLMFAAAKRLRYHMRDVSSGGDRGHQDRGTEIGGKTLGVVGFGRIGRELGELASRLGMRVVAYDPYVRQDDVGSEYRIVTLGQLLSESDFVVLTTALTAETRHIIDAAELERMKPTAYLINVGRGGLVNETALLSALRRRQIAGAGLDVWETEPVSPDNPLLALDNVIGTPHRLAATWESLERLCRGIATNVLRVLNGQPPLNIVNAEVIASQRRVI